MMAGIIKLISHRVKAESTMPMWSPENADKTPIAPEPLMPNSKRVILGTAVCKRKITEMPATSERIFICILKM
jgi:hypothetical protein